MSETSFSKQTASLAKTFMFRGFDPEEWARSLSAQSDGDKDLIEKREKIRSLNDETCLKETGSKDLSNFSNTEIQCNWLSSPFSVEKASLFEL